MPQGTVEVEAVVAAVRDYFGGRVHVAGDTRLVEDLGYQNWRDELDFVEAIEAAVEATIPHDAYNGIQTVADLANAMVPSAAGVE